MKKITAFVLFSMLLASVAFAAVGAVEGTVVNSEGNPVEAAKVSLQLDGFCVLTVYTSEDGVYLFTDVEEGIYSLIASKKRTGNFTVENVEVVASETNYLPVITLVSDGLGGGNGPHHNGGKTEETPSVVTVEKSATQDEISSIDAIKALYR